MRKTLQISMQCEINIFRQKKKKVILLMISWIISVCLRNKFQQIKELSNLPIKVLNVDDKLLRSCELSLISWSYRRDVSNNVLLLLSFFSFFFFFYGHFSPFF